MANAEVTAPVKKEKKFIEIELGSTSEKVLDGSNEHKYLTKEFDPFKRYVFELSEKNPSRDLPIINARTNKQLPHQEFKPYRNLVFTSQVIWNGARRIIRYYDGCETIFFDKQPKEKEIVQALIAQTRRREFLNGKISPEGVERMLLLYMYICAWNVESPFRAQRASPVFRPSDSEDSAERELELLDKEEKALKYAKEATFSKMKIHSSYLGMELMNYDSGAELTEKELRAKYRRFAVDDPEKFLESYGNEKIEIKFFVDKAWEKGLINNKNNPNKASWANSGTVICDISGLTSWVAICQRLFEFSQTDDGVEFLIQLKSISKEI